jgi:hypothetical protein
VQPEPHDALQRAVDEQWRAGHQPTRWRFWNRPNPTRSIASSIVEAPAPALDTLVLL